MKNIHYLLGGKIVMVNIGAGWGERVRFAIERQAINIMVVVLLGAHVVYGLRGEGETHPFAIGILIAAVLVGLFVSSVILNMLRPHYPRFCHHARQAYEAAITIAIMIVLTEAVVLGSG